jgi:hypothetical protein
MSTEENDYSNAAVGQKRPGALSLGPKKKAVRYAAVLINSLTYTLNPAVVQIHLYTMEDILDALSMPYVPSVPF